MDGREACALTEQPKIAVVMSTYNGAEHLREQIDSVLAQQGVEVRLIVRDDGSRDATVGILRGYEAAGALELLNGDNLGVVGSFLAGLARVPDGYDYIALCDQDDVWNADKLARAAEVLSGKDNSIPQVYVAEYTFCDAKMSPQGRSHLNRNGVDYAKMLYENMTSGNTMVINPALLRLIVGAGREGVYCHDWWISLVGSALGELTYDDFSCLQYRRTGSNASPTGSGELALLRYRVKTFFAGEGLEMISGQLRKLDDCFGDTMEPQKRELLHRFLRGGRLAKAFAPVRLRQKMPEELALRLLFLLGKL